MKAIYINTLRKALVKLYQPCIYRIEKIRATIAWHSGVRQCIKKRNTLDKPRFYMLYDTNTHSFISMTYNTTKDTVSVRSLLRMGKLHVHRTPSVTDLKRECFYYTDSRWGAPQCNPKQKLAEWLTYYLNNISTPIRKLNTYKQTHSL